MWGDIRGEVLEEFVSASAHGDVGLSVLSSGGQRGGSVVDVAAKAHYKAREREARVGERTKARRRRYVEDARIRELRKYPPEVVGPAVVLAASVGARRAARMTGIPERVINTGSRYLV